MTIRVHDDMLDRAADDYDLTDDGYSTITDTNVEAEAVAAGLDVVLAAVLDVGEKVDAIAARIDALEAEVRPLVEAAKQLGPMAEKMAQGGLMGLLRPS